MPRRRRDEERTPLQPSSDDRRRADIQELLVQRANVPQFTLRATVVGLFVGTLVCFSNMYFGLQTGWISLMSMQSSLIGFTVFKVLEKKLGYPFTPVENVFVQTVAVAVGSMPITAGLVGVIPALEKLLKPEEGGPLALTTGQLVVWTLGVAFFGIFFAVPLRKQFIIKEKLKFPSGAATALMISVLHGDKTSGATYQPIVTQNVNQESPDAPRVEGSSTPWETQTKILFYSFAVSGIYTLITYFFPTVRDLPVFGSNLATAWLWTFNPSPAYIGQGIIMGTETTLHMLLGAFIGWGILAPLAKNNGWAPGPIGDWKEGSRGWIIWVSLAVMLADSIVSLGLLVSEPIRGVAIYLTSKNHDYQRLRGSEEATTPNLTRRHMTADASDVEDVPEVDAPPQHQVSNEIVVMGILLSSMLCITTTSIVFDQMPFYTIIIAVLFALVLSVMAVRALGQTDINPVSGISKLTQLLFALIVPASSKGAVIVNLVAGAVSEAGALQAGDLMQDLKVGHLLGAAPKAQFRGQIIGSIVGAVVSVGIYKLYNSVYQIPSKLFQIPTAYVWIDCGRLVFGTGLPPHARDFAIIFGLVFAVITFMKIALRRRPFINSLIPGGIAFAVGMYNVPSFTLARAVGGLLRWVWQRYMHKTYGETPLVILASGLILGEGLVSIVNLVMASLEVPTFGFKPPS